MKQKTEAALKDITIDKFHNYFEEWKKRLKAALHQMDSTFKVTEV